MAFKSLSDRCTFFCFISSPFYEFSKELQLLYTQRSKEKFFRQFMTCRGYIKNPEQQHERHPIEPVVTLPPVREEFATAVWVSPGPHNGGENQGLDLPHRRGSERRTANIANIREQKNRVATLPC